MKGGEGWGEGWGEGGGGWSGNGGWQQKQLNSENVMWPKTLHTPEPILSAACEKNVFQFFRSSARGKHTSLIKA